MLYNNNIRVAIIRDGRFYQYMDFALGTDIRDIVGTLFVFMDTCTDIKVFEYDPENHTCHITSNNQ